MSRYRIEKATADDNEALCALCAIPMKGDIMLTLERSPDFFTGANVQCEEAETYVCRRTENGALAGVFSVGKRRVFYQNQVQPVRYFSDLRVHPDAQGSRLLYEIGRFITDHIFLPGEVAQTIVFADNNVMLQQIESLQKKAKKMSLFKYFPAGNYVSYMVKPSLKKKRKTDPYLIRKAETKDIPAMQELLVAEGSRKAFFPYYEFAKLTDAYYAGLSLHNFYLAFDKDELVGIAGTWNQQAYKQTRIYNYSPLYSWLRPVINIYGWLTHNFTLPSKGTVLNYVTVHSMIARENNSNIVNSLLQEISHECRQQQYSYFLVGLDEKDNLNKALVSFPTKRVIKGRHFIVSNSESMDDRLLHAPYYLEAARI